MPERRVNGKGRKLKWRARCKWQGRYIELGEYLEYADAVAAERKFRIAHGIREQRKKMVPKWVTMHLPSGDFPALVVVENGDGTLNLTVFAIHDTYYRDMVREYVPKLDDEPEDRYGFYSN